MKGNISEMLFGGSWPEDDRSPHLCGMNLAEWCLSGWKQKRQRGACCLSVSACFVDLFLRRDKEQAGPAVQVNVRALRSDHRTSARGIRNRRPQGQAREAHYTVTRGR